ncbi:hypothetical protein CTA1_12474 [Colletotrichum tanaceti]|uniref:Uncharacterized protein n=1 Tax=Colletotrichum tanaceti TaxID=1306861 RepID=A0A4U6XA91_9PEZI|nr:hypothetical protein CTA1_12474 [Colletotrichum tanaceti]
MSGRKPRDAPLGRDTPPGQTGSQAQTSSASSAQENEQGAQRPNPGAMPPDQPDEGRQDAESMAPPPSIEQPGPPALKLNTKRVSWAVMAAKGASSKNMDMRDTAPISTPSQAVPMKTMKGPSPNVATWSAPAPARINEGRKQESTSTASTTNPDVVGPDDVAAGERARDSENPEATRAPLPQPNPSAVEASSTTDRSVEQECLRDLKRYLRELAGTHGLPSTLTEHLSNNDDDSSETTFTTTDALFKDFVARLSGEFSAKDKSLRETRTKLQTAVNEYNEKEIAMQRLGLALEEAERRNQQMAPPVDTEVMEATISGLREELKVVKTEKAVLERDFERTTEVFKRKDDERSKQLEHQDSFVKDLQDKNDKYEILVQRLRHEKDEERRRAAEAEAARAPVTFRVDNEILTQEEYEKCLDNARGDVADLQAQLEQAKNDLDAVLQGELTVDDVRDVIEDLVVPIYGAAMEEQFYNSLSIWNDEEGGLMSLAGKDGYLEYVRVAAEPDRLPSEASSPGHGYQAPEDLRTGEGDVSAKLREELAGCEAQRVKANERIEELESERKKQQDDIDKLRSQIQKLKEETAASTKDLGKETEALEKKVQELAGCEAQRVKAHERIEVLETEAKKHQDDIDSLQSQIQKLETAASTKDKKVRELVGCEAQRVKAHKRIEVLETEAKKQQDNINSLHDEIRKLETAASTKDQKVQELAGCEAQRVKAHERIQELETEAKKQQGKIDNLQSQIHTLEETAASSGDLSKEAEALRKKVAELAGWEAQRVKAHKRIEVLESEAKKQQDEVNRLQDEIRKLEQSAASTREFSEEAEALRKKVAELAGCEAQHTKACERIKELEAKTTKQQGKIDSLQSQIHTLEETVASAKDLSEEAEVLRKRVDELAGWEVQYTKACERIKELEDVTKNTENDINRLQDKNQKLEETVASAKDLSEEAEVLRKRVDELAGWEVQHTKACERIKELENETDGLRSQIRTLEETAASAGELSKEAEASRKKVQEMEQHIADLEETAKLDNQKLQEASAVEMRDKQAELDGCRTLREQADKEIEELKAEAERREKELRKLSDKFALQQQMDELLKRQIDASEEKVGRAEAKAQWAETRALLRNQRADGEDAGSSSIEDDPDQHLELLANLFDRVNEAEDQLGESHREVESTQAIVATLRAGIRELEAQRDRLRQEKEQLQGDLDVYAESGQAIGEENMALKEKLREKEAEIEGTSAAVRKLEEELAAKEEELGKKQKALDDCRAHGKALREEIAELKGRQDDKAQDGKAQDDESEEEEEEDDDDDDDEESKKTVTRLEERITELEEAVKKEASKARNETARRVDAENNGVWEGTRGAALKNMETDLYNFKLEHANTVGMYEKELGALKETLRANKAELERVKLEQQQVVDDLQAKLKAAGGKRCSHVDTDLEEVKRGHQLIVDDLQAKLEDSDSKRRDLEADLERTKTQHKQAVGQHEQAIGALTATLAASEGKSCNHVDTDLEEVKLEYQRTVEGLESKLEAAEEDSRTKHAELERIRLEHQQTESDLKSELEAAEENSRTSRDELERAEVEHKRAMDELEARLKTANARNIGRDDSALDEIKLEHQKTLDDLGSRHENAENSSRRSREAELERIKAEHQKDMDELEAKVLALEGVRDALQDALKDPLKDSHKGAQSTADSKTPTDAATETTDAETQTTVDRSRLPGACLDATSTRPFNARPSRETILAALQIQRKELMMLETVHRRLYDRAMSSGDPKTPEAETAGPSGTPGHPETTPTGTSDGSAHQRPHISGPTPDDRRAIRLENIKQSCEAFAEKIRENETYAKDFNVRSALHEEIRALRQKLKDLEAKQRDGATDGVDQQQQQQQQQQELQADDAGNKDTGKAGDKPQEKHDGPSEDESDDDNDQDPGNDPVAILKRIARLERKMDETQKEANGQEGAVLDLIDRIARGNRVIHGLSGHPCEPFCSKDSDRVKQKVDAAQGGIMPRCPMPRPSESDQDDDEGEGDDEDEDDESSSDEGDFHPHGNYGRARLSLGEQEALVRSIQAQLVNIHSFATACDEAWDDVRQADQDLRAIPDPVPGGRVCCCGRGCNRRRTTDPARRAAQEAEEEDDDHDALLRANAYDDPVSEASSIASDDIYSVGGNPNPNPDRALKSFIPHTVYNVLESWKTNTAGLLQGADRIQFDVEGLIHAGFNSERYAILKRRVRRLRKLVADAAATNAHLQAQLSERIAAGADDVLREELRELKHQNNTLKEQVRVVAEQSRTDGGAEARDERVKQQQQLQKDLVQEKALVGVERAKLRRLAEEKDELEATVRERDETIRTLEASRAKSIKDGLDREMRETLFDNDELGKEVERLKGEVGALKRSLEEELMNKTAQVGTAQAVIQGMKKQLDDAQRRSDVAEDKRATLMTDIERALDIGGEDDTTRLDKTRRRLANILCRVEEGEHDGEEGDDTAEVDEYRPVSQRERELVREILDEKKKRAKHLAEERKRYEGRLDERHAEYEKQVAGWKAMHDAAEAARELAERNLTDTLGRMGALRKRADWQEKMLAEQNKRLQEQCNTAQQLAEELDGLGGDETAGVVEVGGDGGGGGGGGGSRTSAGGQGRGRTPGEEEGRPRTPRQTHEQPGGGAAGGGGDPGNDPGDSSSSSSSSSDGESDDDDDENNTNHDDNPVRTPRDRSPRCACPCVGLCNDPANPTFDGLPTDAFGVVRDVCRVYKSYRACCGTKRGATTPRNDGRLLWRLMCIMRADADVREQMRNAGRAYAARLLLAFRGCLWVRVLSWAQAVATVVVGLVHCAALVVPGGRRWKPRRPGALPPQRAAMVAQDVAVLCVLYQAWRVLEVSRAARGVWEVANGYTRAYFVERGLHPERSTWFGLDGVDMRLLGTSGDAGRVPLSTAVGDGMGG